MQSTFAKSIRMKIKKRRHLFFSVGIMCHNEEQNILNLLKSLRKQSYWRYIKDIIVVSSGSTDQTNKFIKSFAKTHRKLSFINEKKRRGKAHAINKFLVQATIEIIVLISADLMPTEKSLEFLVKHFYNKKVGIVGSHPIPMNDKNTFLGFAVHLLWDLHHQISLKNPKMGEMIAFRRVFKKISDSSVVDEVNIESLIKGQGYKAVYEPRAIVYNKGPSSISDFITARRRIYVGHIATKYEYSYSVSTLDNFMVLKCILKNIRLSPTFLLYLIGTILLELISRVLGYVDYRFKLKDHTIWEVITS